MKKLLASSILILALFATSCAAGFDRQEAIDDLVGEGLPRAQAECVIDGSIEEFGESKLGSNDEPTADDEAKIFEIMTECFSAG